MPNSAKPKPGGHRVDQKGDSGSVAKELNKEERKSIQSNYGVKMLLEAERKYKMVVEEAKLRRKALLKKARVEAKDEIEKFRNERNEIFHQKLEQIEKQKAEMAKQIEENTIAALENIAKCSVENRDKALQLLESEVVNINPTPHPNFIMRKKITSGTYKHSVQKF